jgi:hypothetical protein
MVGTHPRDKHRFAHLLPAQTAFTAVTDPSSHGPQDTVNIESIRAEQVLRRRPRLRSAADGGAADDKGPQHGVKTALD